jgi:hypothetical protein
VCLAVAVGFLCAIAEWGWPGPVAGAASVALVVAVVVAPFKVDDGLDAVPGIARAAVAAGLVLPAVAGLVAVLGLAGLLVFLVLGVTMPGLAALLRGGWRLAAHPPGTRPPGRVPPAALASTPANRTAREERAPRTPHALTSMDDDALCLAWRRSFHLLEVARSAGDRLQVVKQRQEYLDELHRRSPQGLATWLASGARASGNPRPYLRNHRHQAG